MNGRHGVMTNVREGKFDLLCQREIAADIWEMKLRGDCTAISRPGQFVDVSVPGFFLRRPISVANLERVQGAREAELTLVYKVVGEGTAALADLSSGATLNLLTGLGNGFGPVPDMTPDTVPDAGYRSHTSPAGSIRFAPAGSIHPEGSAVTAEENTDAICKEGAVLLIGGGVGVPPLYWLARELRAAGRDVRVVLGFNTAADVFYEREFAQLGCAPAVATADGSYGVQGFVTTLMPPPDEYSYFYTCGPLPMLRAVNEVSGRVPGEFSFEERMGCGYGACMGCSHHVRLADGSEGYKRVCAEGPVLRKEEIIWEK
ncbi:MAG: dihydroorotate dehydrogenase electron transfer subunit [Actinomycetaceae bacterium]|nr:dihydroorotate dehydrogenase electron transfer subunit [Arcanobacterium sp.]MDD7686812.1 dihydroorotate dehydrogenase electron transfer subunit [Actinomycetaceae bacterium]MDY5273605.1 dihydroorotate dehydrogenase electron transfer subunit [Arcanobacterium sp.]